MVLMVACQTTAPAPTPTPSSTPPPTIINSDTTDSGRYPAGTEIRFLQWNHFVPQYDKWFDPFVTAWGDEVGVQTSIEHIPLTELSSRLQTAIIAGEGPTLVELIIAASVHVEGVHDLTDLNLQAQEQFGEQVSTCHANSYLPTTGQYYGYCVAWAPDPGNYNINLWTEAGFPDGPQSWEDLLVGGQTIRDTHGIGVGLGISPEMDSEMAQRAILWSFGASVQDENENVVINSPETLAALEYIANLYQSSMAQDVFDWNPATNNQELIAGNLSYILNSVSAYRSLQKIDAPAADNIGFVPALEGPAGRYASSHVWSIYVIPNYVQGAELEAAQEFLLHLTANYDQATFNSELYNFPAFPSTVPQLDDWLTTDPFNSTPANKLNVLATADEWGIHLGYPGTANPAVAEVFAQNIITTMMRDVATGEKTAEEALAIAEAEINVIYDKWRQKGLIGNP
ncbi:MAG TPA: extracellular solute-binding protein [Anaerolineae bacterium]|nr:extracellular solute-binding protein [Anaerolineae bacterium]